MEEIKSENKEKKLQLLKDLEKLLLNYHLALSTETIKYSNNYNHFSGPTGFKNISEYRAATALHNICFTYLDLFTINSLPNWKVVWTVESIFKEPLEILAETQDVYTEPKRMWELVDELENLTTICHLSLNISCIEKVSNGISNKIRNPKLPLLLKWFGANNLLSDVSKQIVKLEYRKQNTEGFDLI